MHDGVGRKFIEETPDDEGNVKERFHGSIGCVMSSCTVGTRRLTLLTCVVVQPVLDAGRGTG